MVAAAKSSQFALPDGGRQAVSASHVDNVVECMILAAEKGRGGEAYYVTDGEDSTLKDVLDGLLGTRGIPPIQRTWRPSWKVFGARFVFALSHQSPVRRCE